MGIRNPVIPCMPKPPTPGHHPVPFIGEKVRGNFSAEQPAASQTKLYNDQESCKGEYKNRLFVQAGPNFF